MWEGEGGVWGFLYLGWGYTSKFTILAGRLCVVLVCGDSIVSQCEEVGEGEEFL